MILSVKRLWQSISFRLTLNYGLLAILTTLMLMVFIYFQVVGALRTEYMRQITAAAQRLTAAFDSGGREALVAAIELTLLDMVDSDREIYLLLDESGKKLAGNLEISSSLRSTDIGVFESDVVRDGLPTRGRLKIQTLAGGEALVVGHDLREMNELTSLIGQVIMAALVLAVSLAFVGAYIFRRELEYRVGHVRQTTRQIGEGQLSRRVPFAEGDDEFALLNRDINAMLDKIELLMKGARHISDTIAHNLRTPMTRIVGALREARRPDASRAELLAANQSAITEIERLNILLEKLLHIAEMEAGIRRRTFKSCRLDVIVADMMEMYTSVAEERGISLCVEALQETAVCGDANLLGSACANLLDNAVKYASSQVRVGVFREHRLGRVVIQDDGPGVSAAEYENLGKYFHRLDPSSEGHGLGLTSVRSIVDLHGGSLEFSDAGPGLVVSLSLALDSEVIT